MARSLGWTLLLSVLMGCSRAEPAPVSPDHAAIVAAVLARQADGAAEWRAAMARDPGQRSLLGRMLDHRLCVSRQTAGSAADFQRGARGHVETDALVARWQRSERRHDIPEKDLPQHLRWDALLSVCPSGVLSLGNPVIAGDEARLFFMVSCPGLCGGGGEISLRRVKGRWAVAETMPWWVS